MSERGGIKNGLKNQHFYQFVMMNDTAPGGAPPRRINYRTETLL
jgi:hypothetical protein